MSGCRPYGVQLEPWSWNGHQRNFHDYSYQMKCHSDWNFITRPWKYCKRRSIKWFCFNQSNTLLLYICKFGLFYAFYHFTEQENFDFKNDISWWCQPQQMAVDCSIVPPCAAWGSAAIGTISGLSKRRGFLPYVIRPTDSTMHCGRKFRMACTGQGGRWLLFWFLQTSSACSHDVNDNWLISRERSAR